MDFRFKILIVGSNASLVNFIAAKIRKLSDNPITVADSIPKILTMKDTPYLIFLSAELEETNPMIPDITGMLALKKKFPSAGIVIFGDDNLQNNLAYVTNGARDYITRSMLVLPQIENYLKKRINSDWVARPIYAN